MSGVLAARRHSALLKICARNLVAVRRHSALLKISGVRRRLIRRLRVRIRLLLSLLRALPTKAKFLPDTPPLKRQARIRYLETSQCFQAFHRLYKIEQPCTELFTVT
jgi:hypothetical protein